jgi:hypothetical protein
MLTAILTVLLLPSSALAWDPGVITTFAGTGESPGYSGDGGAAMAAQLDSPHGISLDDEGNLFIADRANNCVRMVPVESGTYYNIVMTGGCIYTIAGDGTVGFSGDGGAATSAQLHWPHGVTVDSLGNVYIADTYNHRIRKVDTSGIITTFGGTGQGVPGDGDLNQRGSTNHGGHATLGNLYIADYFIHRIRMVAATAPVLRQEQDRVHLHHARHRVWDYGEAVSQPIPSLATHRVS